MFCILIDCNGFFLLLQSEVVTQHQSAGRSEDDSVTHQQSAQVKIRSDAPELHVM